MPAPTTETLATVLSLNTLASPMNGRALMHSTASSSFAMLTVKTISFVLSLPTDWRMISTFMLFFASCEKTLNAIPGTSSTPTIEIFDTSLSFVTPLTNIFSILVVSFTIVPGIGLRLEITSSSTLYFFAISTERLLRTCAPSVASSSISSYVISWSLRAPATLRGSAV